MEYMILFLALFRGIFMHPWHTVQGLMLACMPPVLTLEGCACTCAHWTWKRTHRHSYTTTSAYITESSTLPEALVRRTRTYTRSQCIYLAQELTWSFFTCLIVLVGHEMRLLGCVSVEEKRRNTWQKFHLIPSCSPRSCFQWLFYWSQDNHATISEHLKSLNKKEKQG